MTTDFRALCAELFDQLSAYDGCDDVEEVSQHWNYTNCNELLHCARVALATPPPEPPTEQKSSIDELIAGCKPLDPEMAEVLTTEARWRLFGEQDSATPPPEPKEVGDAIAHQAYVAFVQICKGGSDDAGTYEEDEALVRCALKRLDKLESALATPPPKPPTDEELLKLGNDLMGDCLPCDPDLLLNFARAALERWGK